MAEANAVNAAIGKVLASGRVTADFETERARRQPPIKSVKR